MVGFQGADTEALRAAAQFFARRADALDDLRAHLTLLVDGTEWVGEDADRFRAEWSGIVRPGLQDGHLELRYRARQLLQHAEEQESASTVDGPAFAGIGGAAGIGVAAGIGAGVAAALGAGFAAALAQASPGQALGALSALAQVVRDALVGDGSTPRQQALAALLDSPLGRLGLLAGMLGGMIGSQVGELIGSALLDALPGHLLAQLLGSGRDLGEMLGLEPMDDMMGRSGEGLEGLTGIGDGSAAGAELGDAGAADAGSGADGGGSDAAGAGPGGSGGGGGSGSDGGGSGGGDGGSGGGGSASGAGGGGETGAAAGAEAAAGGAASTAGGGLPAMVQGPAEGAAAMFSGRIGESAVVSDDGGSLWDQIVAMFTEVLESGAVPGVRAGMDIGSAHLDR